MKKKKIADSSASIEAIPMLAAVYRCPTCGKKVKRNNNKQWIRSWCDEAGKYTRLQKIKKDESKKETCKRVN